MINKITTEWKDGVTFESDNPSGNTFLIDDKVEGADKRAGLAPKSLMLSALAGCTGLDVISVLDKMKVTDYEFKMDVTGELTEEHPKYYHKVKLDYHFYGKDLNKKKIKKAVGLSVDKYCGVMEMFRQFAKLETEIHYHNK
ncbi:OsmC family protein [Flavobacteriaceae bacterium S0825]|uniref:OsmC family protein n=1 Tax=Gaetbulibacter sp. S0825 TaxID=2720084 RepID=UPI001431B9FC|nr:OsmC family protein [Gaetbulibacter sp. S0825]MCK0108191.1 OsmC family protein [Flavobacteriaceae bacterium S0825]NIX63827.1 OsmC family protein [Gaetbulibacter sp. S0825]